MPACGTCSAKWEVVFGFWAFVLLAFIFFNSGPGSATHYLEGLNFTEPAFVFVIMVVAASRPILELCKIGARGVARFMPVKDAIAFFISSVFDHSAPGFFSSPSAARDAGCNHVARQFLYARGIPSPQKHATLGSAFR